jgi:hypothetical protein
MKKINIEYEFKKCVSKTGGQILDDVLKQPRFKNADYWFPEHETIAELKILSENLSIKKDFQCKVNKLFLSWMERKLIPQMKISGTVKFDLQTLPEICANEYIGIIKKRLESSIIKKANKQIRETKQYMGKDKAKGLLIIANDGNLMMHPRLFLYLLNRILNKNHSNINSIIYFTANLPVSLKDSDYSILENTSKFLWIDGIVQEREPVSKQLRECLQLNWMQHHSLLFPEIPIREILLPNKKEIIDKIDLTN